MTSLAVLRQLLRSRPRIVATADLTPEGIAALEDIGPLQRLGWAAGEWFADRAALAAALADAELLVAGYESIDAELLAAAPRLRLIASVRSAPQANVDLAAATARGIAVLSTTGRTDHAVAEFTVAVALAMARHLVPATSWMTARPAGFDPGEPFYRGTVWGVGAAAPQLRFTGFELHRRTLGLVGFGAIGRMTAQKFAGFGMRILACDPHVPAAVIESHGAVPATFEALLAQADIVSLHARLTPETRGLIDAAALARMKPGALLINTGRAGLVDRAALLAALDTGHVAAAALDVFDAEPPAPDDALVAHPRALATPHVAAWTVELCRNHTNAILDNLRRIAAGEAGATIANPEVFEAGAPT